jgi:predicted amidohydrolase YtcJ
MGFDAVTARSSHDLDIEDALRSITINGASLTCDEQSPGRLEVGKFADLVVADLADIRELERGRRSASR